MYRYLIMSFIFIAINGCAVPNFSSSAYGVTKVTISANADRVIIKDLLKLVKMYYPPARTKFLINPQRTTTNNRFAQRLESEFMAKGYAITRDSRESDATKLIWKIDLVGKLVRVSFFIGTATISKVYIRMNSSYRGYSPFTAKGLK